MFSRTTLVLAFALAFALALSADTPDVTHFRMPLLGAPDLRPLSVPGTMPDIFMAVAQHPSNQPADLKPQSRLEIIRYVSGEYVKVVKPLPGGRKGFKVEVGKPVVDKELQQALRAGGIAANPGDTVQITALEFRARDIVIQVNGGGKKKYRWRDHLQIGAGGPVSTTSSASPPPDPGSIDVVGSTIVLDYGRPIPDMSAEDLMHDLGPFLDFSKEHSAAVNWIDTLPPQFKQAIKDRLAVVGMDHEMVLAAMGRPDHKVRERDPNGDQTEDWIYGSPPAKTVFVTFNGDKVIKVKEYD
ncbi:MAG: hypothetical protein WB780_02755 [Candidatus Acidiferrales bacterium]